MSSKIVGIIDICHYRMGKKLENSFLYKLSESFRYYQVGTQRWKAGNVSRLSQQSALTRSETCHEVHINHY